MTCLKNILCDDTLIWIVLILLLLSADDCRGGNCGNNCGCCELPVPKDCGRCC